jgi:hypothetical protein
VPPPRPRGWGPRPPRAPVVRRWTLLSLGQFDWSCLMVSPTVLPGPVSHQVLASTISWVIYGATREWFYTTKRQKNDEIVSFVATVVVPILETGVDRRAFSQLGASKGEKTEPSRNRHRRQKIEARSRNCRMEHNAAALSHAVGAGVYGNNSFANRATLP